MSHLNDKQSIGSTYISLEASTTNLHKKLDSLLHSRTIAAKGIYIFSSFCR